jgi:putative addiction module killer protein
MDEILIEIRYYKTAQGRIPFLEWLDDLLDVEAKRLIRLRLGHLRLGNFGDCRSLGLKLYELKMSFGPGYRIYFANQNDRLIIVFAAGLKSTQEADIRKARFHLSDYQLRIIP